MRHEGDSTLLRVGKEGNRGINRSYKEPAEYP